MATTDIIVGYAKLWRAPLAEANPDETTVVYGGDWGGNWENVGYTQDGVQVASTTEVFKARVDQLTVPVKQAITEQTLTIQTKLAEFTADNLALLFGGTPSTTAPGASQVGYTELAAGVRSAPDEYKVGIEALYKDSSNNELPVRWIFHRGSFTQNGDISFTPNGVAAVPIAIEVLADTSQASGEELFVLQIVTAPATT